MSDQRKTTFSLSWLLSSFLIGAAVVFACFSSWAAGLTIPAGSVLNVGSGTLRVELSGNSGNIDNAGTLLTADGAIYLNGNWTMSGAGYYNGGTGGTVYFTGTGTQTITRADVNIAIDNFYNLVHDTSGVLALSTLPVQALDINGSFVNTAGTFDPQNVNMNVAGNWNNSGTFNPGTATVTLDGGDQAISGKTTFATLVKQLTDATSHTLTFPSGPALTNETVAANIVLKGFDVNTPLDVRSSLPGQQAVLTVNATQDIRYVNVQDNNANNGVLLFARSSESASPSSINNWHLGSSGIHWVGTTSTDWNDASNWDANVVPQTGDSVVIPVASSGRMPVISMADAFASDLTIETGASVTLDNRNLTLDWILYNAGTIILNGTPTSELVTASSILDSGTVEFKGTTAARSTIMLTRHFFSGASYWTTFHDLIINEQDTAASSRDTFTTDASLYVTHNLTITSGLVTIDPTKNLTVGNDLSINYSSATVNDVFTSGNSLTVGGQWTVSNGTVNAAGSNVDANSIRINNGTLSAPGNGKTFTVSGDWEFPGGTFIHNNGTVTFDATSISAPSSQMISGDTVFYNFVKQVPANAVQTHTLVLTSLSTQTVQNYLTLTGVDGSVQKRLYLVSSGSGSSQRAKLTLQSGGGQTINNVDVRGNDASGGLLLVDRGAAVNSGANLHWNFGTTGLTWSGAVSTFWDDRLNWVGGVAPGTGDTVTIPVLGGANPHYPELTAQSGAISLSGLTLATGNTTLTLNGYNLAATSYLTNGGKIILQGGETVNIAGLNSSSGTFEYRGDGNGTPDTRTIKIVGSNTFYNLTTNDTHAVKDNFVIDADMWIYGTLTASSGALSLDAANVMVDGSVYVTGGTLTSPRSGKTFSVVGNFVHSAGTFDPNHGAVTLTGVDQGIYGSTRFDDLIKDGTGGEIVFDHSGGQTVSHFLRLKGTSGHELLLRSDSPDTDPDATRAWGLVLQPAGLQEIDYVNVKDSNATGGLTLVGRHSTNSLFNQNWSFSAPKITWTGLAGTSDWNNVQNWDVGVVPIVGDNVVIAPAAKQPDLASFSGMVSPNDLTLQAGATLTLSGKALTVQDTLVNEGTIILRGNEAVSILHPDINSGTFEYQGDGDGTPDLRTIKNFGPNQFFNVTIDDAHTTKDSFTIDADVSIYGTLTDTSSALNLAAHNVEVDGSVYILGGTVTAPGAGQSFTVGGSWTLDPAGAFVANGGRVTIDSAAPSVVTGSTTFYDLSILAPFGKTISFAGNSTQTVSHDVQLQGGSGQRLFLQSTTDGTKWNLAVPTGMSATEVNVRDSVATVPGPNNYITALNSIDRRDSNGAHTNTGWRFLDLSLITPRDGASVSATPVLVGQGPANQVISIMDKAGKTVAITQADANGSFRVRVGEKSPATLPGTLGAVSLTQGANSLTPNFGGTNGARSDITVVAAPDSTQTPVIVSPVDGAHISGPLPTITGQGKPDVRVDIVVSDAAGHLLLTLPPTSAGYGTVDHNGKFSVTLTTPLPRGTNYVSAIVDGVSSPIFTYNLNDIYGVVFDSASNNPVNAAKVYLYKSDGQTLAQAGVDLLAGEQNPKTTAADGVYGFLSKTGTETFMVRVEGFGYTYPTQVTNDKLPAGRSVTTGSRGELITTNTIVQAIDQPVDGSPFLFKIVKDANKSEAKVGDVVTYAVTIQNLSQSNSVLGTRLYDTIPPGFKFMNGRAQLDGIPITDPTGNRPLIFNVGTFAAQQKKTLRYQLVVGAGVSQGNYDNSAYMKQDTGVIISNHATKTVKIVMDPLFDAGSIFGKVFYDLNENGRQDAPDYMYEDRQEVVEGPVANVKIVMEDGTIVTTDKNGQFHVPNLVPGRHVLRVDEKTLPPGAYVTTDKAQIIDVTAGSVSKVNFGINIDNVQVVGEDARFFREKIKVDQLKDQPVPRLNADVFNTEILIYNATVLEQVEFRIFTNYAPFLQSWKLDILDKDTKRTVKSFAGTRYGMFDPILWDGRDNTGQYIRADRNYTYVLKVEDGKGGWGETKEKPIVLKVLTEAEQKVREQPKTDDERKKDAEARTKRYRDWLLAQSKVNILNEQTILIKGETLVINAQQTDIRSVRILKDGENFADVPVLARQIMTARNVLDGETPQALPIEMIVPEGSYDLEVVSGEGVRAGEFSPSEGTLSDKGGPMMPGISGSAPQNKLETQTKVVNYREPIKVGEDYMMFVALGDGKIGYNVNRGNVEPLQGNEKYKKGFYKEGKLAYYLKGKVRGKYLVTSSFDSERQQKEMFRSVKDEEYYPIYGDGSTINYDATNTQGNLYLLVEWDKSQAIWGNYAVDLKETEFAQYSRTLYGGKVDYASVASTQYGEPRTHVVLFHADVRQRSAHNEFLGTGGSLYYLKNQGVVPGSLKIKLEVRDAVTGLVQSTTDMKEGSDFDVDDGQGRILFWRPVSMSVDSGQIISNNLLQGNPVYVVADYEYELKDKINEGTQGARVQQAVGENVVVGTTYVSETQTGANYQLQGQDVTVHVGKGTTVKAEYAQTTSQDSASFVSTDGGITFSELATGNGSKGRAYGISQDSRLFDRLGIKSYYKWIDNNFSTAGNVSQQGKQLTGLAMTFDLTPITRLSASYDIQKLIEQGNLQTQMQVGAQETRTTVLQLVHEARRLRVTAEIRSQQVTGKNDTYQSEANQAKNSYAVQAEYDVDEKTKLTVKQQVDAQGVKQQDAQATASVTRQLTDKISATVGESFGTSGSATKVGLAANVTPKITVATDYALANSRSGQAGGTSTTSVTAKQSLGAATNVQAKYSISQGPGQGQKMDMVLGADTGIYIDNATIKAGIATEGENQTFVKKNITLDATKNEKDGSRTTSNIKVGESAEQGETTTVTLSKSGDLSPGNQLVSERTLTYGKGTQDKADTYKIVKSKDGRNMETSYARKYSDTQPERSASNIFGLTGDINDKWAASASLEQGHVQNIDGSLYNRLALSAGAGYLEKDEEGKEKLKSSTKIEARFDKGTANKEQFLVYQALEGKVSDETTLSGKFEWSKTQNKTTGDTEAHYKEIMLGGAYRPIAFDRLNLFGKYTYKENQKPQDQTNISDIEQTKMHVLSADGAYDLTDDWQIVERLAYRIMEEKVAGFDFTKTHTWLLVNRANYKIDQDWKVGGEYRILNQKEAKDQKSGFLLEVVRSVNDNVELGIGYNFTDFTDDLTNLSYTQQGPYIRMTGKLYDRTPEERARARQKWIDRKIEIYAWRMVSKEFTKKDSPIVLELNQMYHMAQVASDLGKYEESRQIYKDVILATDMMYEEAAQFVRKHITFEENLYNAFQRAKEYYDKGELWMARKVWEKIVEEAERSMLE